MLIHINHILILNPLTIQNNCIHIYLYAYDTILYTPPVRIL